MIESDSINALPLKEALGARHIFPCLGYALFSLATYGHGEYQAGNIVDC